MEGASIPMSSKHNFNASQLPGSHQQKDLEPVLWSCIRWIRRDESEIAKRLGARWLVVVVEVLHEEIGESLCSEDAVPIVRFAFHLVIFTSGIVL